MTDYDNYQSDDEELLEKAAALAEEERYQEARSLVKKAIHRNRNDLEAWWALAHLATSDAERSRALSEVLSIEPDHMHALHMRDQIKAGSIPSIDTGEYVPNLKASKEPLPRSAFGEHKNYLLPAIFTLVAYQFFWFAGLILNIYFLREARRLHQSFGEPQKNAGCLYWLLGFQIVAIILMIVGGISIVYLDLFLNGI